MKKVLVFKSKFPDGSTHYGVSEQSSTPELYLNKSISIARNQILNGKRSGKFLMNLLKYEQLVEVEIVNEFSSSESAKSFRTELIKKDSNSLNSISLAMSNRIGTRVQKLMLPKQFSKTLTSGNGDKLFYVDLLYVKKQKISDVVDFKKKHPVYSNMVLIKSNSCNIIRN